MAARLDASGPSKQRLNGIDSTRSPNFKTIQAFEGFVGHGNLLDLGMGWAFVAPS